jgi:hypothetical protein
MRYRKEVNEVILRMLAAKLDGRLARHGFKRTPRSLKYRRAVAEAKQVIFMFFESHPSSDLSADAHIYPWTFIGIPAAYELALQMVSDAKLLEGRKEATLTQPIDWAAPKGQRPQWYLTGEGEIIKAGDSIGDYIERWVLPFFDDFSSLRGLVLAFETNDVVGPGQLVEERRTSMQDSTIVCVAAAYLLLGKPEAAMRALEKKFGRPDLRARYSKAFEFVREKLVAGNK